MSQPFAAFNNEILPITSPLRLAITNAYRRDEQQTVQDLLAQLSEYDHAPIEMLAQKLVTSVRQHRTRASGVDALMHEFSLSSQEGIALMCLAEALLRIPDHKTIDLLIADKISKGDWRKHLGESPSLFVNAATWGLLVTGKLVATNSEKTLSAALTKLIAKGGEPLIRKGVDMAMRMLGNQFVTGQTIEQAIDNSQANEQRGYRYSYDMLGEAALTSKDAEFYFSEYEQAIHAIGKSSKGKGIKEGAGISVKLSALHPRYSRSQYQRVMQELLPKLKKLMVLAKHYDIGLNIDAEEADRLELSLDLIEILAFDPDLANFDGIGVVIQAYQKRCPFVLDYLIDLAKRSHKKFMVRLVKGAYWDSEIKRAQVDGYENYPVFTRKIHTDISYLVCAKKLLNSTQYIYPQFATHNALTLATIYTWAEQAKITDYEFQCLHGMGESLYDQVVGTQQLNKPCRIYAPVGSHKTLLAYLVRRLLENGANSSFVNQIVDETIPISSLIADPISIVKQTKGLPHPQINLPINLYQPTRQNSRGFDFSNESALRELSKQLQPYSIHQWHAQPLIVESSSSHPSQQILSYQIFNPANITDIVGIIKDATPQQVEASIKVAHHHLQDWQTVTPQIRASYLLKAANLIEENTAEFIALAIREAGKTFQNAISEIRETVDFLRYYATEINNLSTTSPLGIVVCISPWNFPLAIFIGQISAALAAGNVVIAKPAEQTPLIAFRAIELLHLAGIPPYALQFLPGSGEIVGSALVNNTHINGVIFTGSTEVAQLINQTLSKRSIIEQKEIAFIAETGGQNVLIADSSALIEQVVQDTVISAFDSAGQRCSALRILCLQSDIFEKTVEMLKGAVNLLTVGNPDTLSTDIGPVIDLEAKNKLQKHIDRFSNTSKNIYQQVLSSQCSFGHFIAPTIIKINDLSDLTEEVFGPILHIISFERENLASLIEEVNNMGYGLTLGIHSRIDETINFISTHAKVGNIYVNRNMVGAVVGVQPFGGQGKSGTGPKAGGPLYLQKLQKSLQMPYLQQSISPTELPSIRLLTDWLITNQFESIANLSKQYSANKLLNYSINLNGPTGEINNYSLQPKGHIYCASTSLPTLLNQISSVLASNNIPVLSKATFNLLPKSFPVEIKEVCIESDHITHYYFQLALSDSGLYSLTRHLFTLQPLCITTVLLTNESDAIPFWLFFHERSISINTTASGGNASLMSLSI